MKLSELWKEYQFLTQSLSENSRKLAFAGAAICWFFKTEQYTFPPAILWALIFIVLFFFFDIFQYLISAGTLKYWTRKKEVEIWNEKSKLVDKEVNKPDWLDKPGYYSFLIKMASLLISFIFLIAEFLYRL